MMSRDAWEFVMSSGVEGGDGARLNGRGFISRVERRVVIGVVICVRCNLDENV